MISSLEDFAGPNIFKTAIHQAYKPQTSFPTDRQRRWCGARAWRLQPSARSECRKINSRWGIPTAILIAHDAGRRARLIEFDPAYCDRIARRFEQVTGKQAILAATGRALRSLPRRAP
jgi:hypothetical protein